MTLCALLPVSLAQSAQPNATNTIWVAHRFALDLDGSGAYYALTLPQTAYAASQRDDLGDLRVFNGAREPVPYSLDAPDTPTTHAPPQRRAVKWFPLPPVAGGSAQSAPPGVLVAADGALRVNEAVKASSTRGGDLVDLGSAGSAGSVHDQNGQNDERDNEHNDKHNDRQNGKQNNGQSDRQSDRQNSGQNNTQNDRPDEQVRALLVHLRNARYQGRVSVEASNDLSTWAPLADAQLLKVEHDGSTLLQERIDLDGASARYLRLGWPDGAPDIASVEVEVQKAASAPGVAPQRQWRDGMGMRAGKTPGEYLFETDGAYPVDRLRLMLPQPNTLARATIYSRANAQTPWREAAQGVLYRLRGKTGEQGNPPLELDADTDRQWRIVVDMRNGGLGSGVPVATVGWRPAVLTFVARGAAPFVLGVGNAALESAATRRDDLVLGASPDIVAAHVGAALPALSAPPQGARQAAARDGDAPRRYVLWAALLLAVAVLGGMAWRLARSQGNGGGQG